MFTHTHTHVYTFTLSLSLTLVYYSRKLQVRLKYVVWDTGIDVVMMGASERREVALPDKMTKRFPSFLTPNHP